MGFVCPACGYDPKFTDYKRGITILLSERSGSTAKSLKHVVNLIIKFVPSDRDNKKVYYFLQAISKSNDRAVNFGLTQFLSHRYAQQQKGFAYLRAIISNVGKDSKAKIEGERKRYGTLPREEVLI